MKLRIVSHKVSCDVKNSGVRWFSFKAWQRRGTKTSIGEHVGRRHLGGRDRRDAGALRAAASTSPPIPPPHGIWGGRAKDAGGTDLSDSGSPEEVLGCEAPTRKDFHLNHPNPRPVTIRQLEGAAGK